MNEKTHRDVLRGVLAACLAGVIATGCATFKTEQIDLSYDDAGLPQREVRTVTKANTFLDSDATLANLKTTQNDQKQDTEVGQVTQKSSSKALSDFERFIIDLLTKGATSGATGGVAPTP